MHFWKFHSSYIFSAPPDPIKSFYQEKKFQKSLPSFASGHVFFLILKKYKCQEFWNLAHSSLAAPSSLFPSCRWSKSMADTRGARVLERCDISRSIYGIWSSPRGAPNIEKCDISRSIYGISSTPSRHYNKLLQIYTSLQEDSLQPQNIFNK